MRRCRDGGSCRIEASLKTDSHRIPELFSSAVNHLNKQGEMRSNHLRICVTTHQQSTPQVHHYTEHMTKLFDRKLHFM